MTQENPAVEATERPRTAVANAVAALQLVSFRVPSPAITGRPRDVIAALLILFLGSLAAHRCYVSGDADFSIWGFQGWTAKMAIWFLAVTVMGILVRRDASVGSLLVVTSMTLLAGVVLNTALYLGFGTVLPSAIIFVLFSVVGLLPFVLAMITLTMTPRRRDGWRGLVIGFGSFALAGVASTYFDQGYLFEAAYTEGDNGADSNWTRPDPEVLYPLQAGLLGRQTAALSAQTPGQIDMYGVLGAGSPDQQIFQREIDEMQRILNARFGAQGHLIMLGATMEEQTARPLLNRTNLAASLRAVADKMDTAEDIGLVFLTAHGGPDELATYVPGLASRNLSSAEVAAALDASGIRHAIIVISACYSGSFVDDLAGPTRLVLTASAADRSSFGCSDSNTFTDWGSAMFASGLQDSLDFRVAARGALKSVGEQETARGLELSLPQISEGADIGAVIDRFVAQGTALK